MKVILLDELRGKGGEGDIVDVAQGFAENYLFPNKVALPATKGNIKQLEERRHNIAKREEQRVAQANTVKETLDGKKVTVEARIGEDGQLFGSVTPAQIVAAINDQLGVDVDRKRLARGSALKTAGAHTVEINLYRDINARLTVQVGPEDVAEVEPAAEEVPAEVAEEPTEEAAAEQASEQTEEVAE